MWFGVWALVNSYLPRWGRFAGIEIQVQVFYLLVSLWFYHRATPTVSIHGRSELRDLRKSEKGFIFFFKLIAESPRNTAHTQMHQCVVTMSKIFMQMGSGLRALIYL